MMIGGTGIHQGKTLEDSYMMQLHFAGKTADLCLSLSRMANGCFGHRQGSAANDSK